MSAYRSAPLTQEIRRTVTVGLLTVLPSFVAAAVVIALAGLNGCGAGAAVTKAVEVAVFDAPMAACVYEAIDVKGARTVADVLADCPMIPAVLAHDVEIVMVGKGVGDARVGCKVGR